MQFEKIRTINKRKMIIGGVISLGVISALIYLPSKAKYRTTESFNIVNGTINYRVPDLNVIAMYTVDEENNEESINNIPTDDSNYTYTLNTDKSACTVDGEKIGSTIELEDGLLNFKGLSQKGTKCSVYFDKVKVPENSAEQTLANLGITNPKEPTSNMFASVATSDKGVFKVADPVYGGTSYYYRGAVINNYVKFANFCWRIIRINGDGSIRMIYDGTACHANGTSTQESLILVNEKYNTNNNRSEYVGYTYEEGNQRTTAGIESNLKIQTEAWYNNNIGNKAEYNSKIADGKFCNDRNTTSDSVWESQPSTYFYYAATNRLIMSKQPTLACPEDDVYTLKAGAITADEVSFAGGVWNTTNNKYYLYNGQYYWTMSPRSYSNNDPKVFGVYSDGKLSDNNGGWGCVTDPIGIRPVINLRADTTFKADTDGTLNNPYIVQ